MHGLHPNLQSFSYDAVVGGILAVSMFLIYAVDSVPSGCFCAFIAGVGVLSFLPVPAAWIARIQPVTLYSFAVGFAVYALFSKIGFETKHSATLDNPKLLAARGVGIE